MMWVKRKLKLKLDGCDRCVDGFVHPAQAAGVHTLRQWPGVRGEGCQEMERNGPRQDGLYRTRIAI